jgi:hypothetical protein
VHDIHAEDISFNWRLGVNVKCSWMPPQVKDKEDVDAAWPPCWGYCPLSEAGG